MNIYCSFFYNCHKMEKGQILSNFFVAKQITVYLHSTIKAKNINSCNSIMQIKRTMLQGKGMKTGILLHLYDILERQNQRDRNQTISYWELRMEEKDSLQSVITFWKKWKLYFGFVGCMQFKTLCTEYLKKLNITKCKLYLKKPEYNFSSSSIFCTIIFTGKKSLLISLPINFSLQKD